MDYRLPNLPHKFEVSAGIFISGRNSVSRTMFTSRPSRARDLVTMAEAGPTPGRVKTGVGSVSRGARTEHNSSDRSVRPTLRFGSDRVHIYYRQFRQTIAYLLRKIWGRLPKLECDFSQLRQAQNNGSSYVENVGILV